MLTGMTFQPSVSWGRAQECCNATMLNAIMDEVRTKKINLKIEFYDYQNTSEQLDIGWGELTYGRENWVTVLQILMGKWSS